MDREWEDKNGKGKKKVEKQDYDYFTHERGKGDVSVRQ